MLRRAHVIHLVLALALVSGPARALDPDKRLHHYVQENWSIEHGLPQATVQAIVQDATGYIWVGTQAGLARFDGARFLNFTPESTPAMPGMMVNALLALANGDVLVGTYRGLARYRNGELQRLGHGPLADLDVRALAKLDDGRILVAGPRGLFRLEGDALRQVSGMVDTPSHALMEDRGGVWVGGVGGVHRMTSAWREWIPFDDDANTTVQAMEAAHGRVWAGTQRGLFVLDRGRWRHFTEQAELASLPIDTLYRDSNDNLWVGTVLGLVRIRDGRVAEVSHRDTPGAIAAVRAVFEDREGNLWVGSQWQALNRLWSGWTRRLSAAEGLHMPVIWSLARGPDGRMLAGTGDGLSEFDGTRFHHLLPGSALPHPDAYTLLLEGEKLWIGTRAGVAVYENGLATRPEEIAGIGNAQVNSMVRDAEGRLWFGTSSGLFSLRGNRLRRLGTGDGLVDAGVRSLLALPQGGLLAGTQAGLFASASATDTRFAAMPGLNPGIDVTALHRTPDGFIVVGTLEEGLYFGDGQRWLDVAALDDVPGNSPFFIGQDSADRLWVAGMRGVYQMSLAALRARLDGGSADLGLEVVLSERGDRRAGQKLHCCNGAGNAKGVVHEDRLWLPTRDGVVVVPMLASREMPAHPTVVIERLVAGGSSFAAQDGAHIELEKGHRDPAFAFTALGFRDPGSVRIRYRLRGYEERWTELPPGAARVARFTNLPARSYSFEVDATTDGADYPGTPTSLAFSIQPLFHETAWFRALMALALIAVFLAVLRHQIRKHVRREANLERLVRERTEDLERANRQLEEMSFRDALTGLHNRRFLYEQLPSDLAHFRRCLARQGDGDDQVMVFALIDLDGFKPINDRLGHHAGDAILRGFARLLEAQIREGDYAVRWGGEEFLLVLRPMPRAETTRVVERVRRATEAHPFDIGDGRSIRVTCSIGLVEHPCARGDFSSLDWEALVNLADFAMYQVKEGGRNGWALLRANPRTRMDTLDGELRTLGGALIAAGELDLHCSPGLRSPADTPEPSCADAGADAVLRAAGSDVGVRRLR